MTKGIAEVARLFEVLPENGANFPAEVYPGCPGVVVAQGRAGIMTWGFPLVLKSKKTSAMLKPKSVNNARADKLGTPFWRDSFLHRRCLIPVTGWAEAEGPKGRMTRTWHTLHGHELFAVAGVWRHTAEWGACYSMIMVDGCEQIADVHDRMPAVLRQENWSRWLGGSSKEALSLCRSCDDPLLIDRTDEPWARPRLPLERKAG